MEVSRCPDGVFGRVGCEWRLNEAVIRATGSGVGLGFMADEQMSIDSCGAAGLVC